ncbi:hypothetical protein ACP6H6_14760 [Vibrio harveyi]
MYESLCFDGEEIGLDISDCNLSMSIMAGEGVEDWLCGFANATEESLIKKELSSRNGKLAVISNLNVNYGMRRRGIATRLIDEVFFDRALDADVFALVVDTAQQVTNGFSLVKFYEDFGFELADQSDHSFPIMYKINE